MKAVVLALVLGTTSVAHAYVPPGGFILGKVADKRANMNLNELEAQVATAWGASSDTVEERMQIKRPLRFRWARSENDNWAYVFREGEAAEVLDGNVTRRSVSFEPMVELLLPRSQNQEGIKAEYVAVCQKLGIDYSLVSLQRFASGVSFMLGVKGKDRDKPSLWIDKDSFQPVRVIYKGENAGQKGIWDVQFREMKDAMPRIIERYFDGKLISRTEVLSVSTSVKIPEGMFQLPAAKGKS